MSNRVRIVFDASKFTELEVESLVKMTNTLDTVLDECELNEEEHNNLTDLHNFLVELIDHIPDHLLPT
jgi:uncharacterized protein YfkK (UPF0435 family)